MSKQHNVLLIVDALTKGGLASVMLDLAMGFRRKGLHVGLLVLHPGIDTGPPDVDWMRVYPDVGPRLGVLRLLQRYRLTAFIRQGIEAYEAQCGAADLVIAAGEMALRCAAPVGHPDLWLSSHSSQLQSPKFPNWFGRVKYRVKILRRGRRVRQLLSGKNVHTVSKGLAWELAAVLGVRAKRLMVIYNPFDVEKIRRLSLSVTPESSGQNGEFIIGIGEFNRRKSFDRLIQAFAQCRFKGDLVLVGQGEEEQNLRQLARKLEVGERVKFVPFHDNHFALLRKAALLVMTSRSEGFGNVLVEALILGRPALSVDCPHGPREILSPFSPEALIPPDRLDLLPERIDSLIARPYAIGAQHLQRFDQDFVLGQYLSLVQRH